MVSSKVSDLQYEELLKERDDLVAENEDLKKELDALDPEFFEQVEDMRYENKYVAKAYSCILAA